MSTDRERSRIEGEAQSLLEDIVRRRGYVHEFHRALAEHDLEFLQAYEELLDAAYLRPRRLSRLTKELIYVALLAGIGARGEDLRAHMAAAASEGATSGDILEVLELTLPVAGSARVTETINVWREVFEV